MAKNALQAQLLKAGLVDKKKAKKLNKQAQHAKRTGDTAADEQKKALAAAQAEKIAKDQQLNQQKQQRLEQKTLTANIVQMINQHQISDTAGDVDYQFVDDGKIKKIHITQKLYNQIVAGHVAIARLADDYALLPHPLAKRIEEKQSGFIVVANSSANTSATTHSTDTASAATQVTDTEDDPYAAYVIPDDLMW